MVSALPATTGRSRSTASGCATGSRAAPGAPWLVFSNSLMTDLDPVGRAGRGLRGEPPHPPLRPARTWRLVGAARSLHLPAPRRRPRRRSWTISASRRRRSSASRWAASRRSGSRRATPSGSQRVAICDCAAALDRAAGAAAWDERIAARRGRRHGGPRRADDPAAGSRARRGRAWRAGSRADPPHDRGRRRRTGSSAPPRALQDYDFSAYPAALRCPALFVAGEEDPPCDAMRPDGGRRRPRVAAWRSRRPATCPTSSGPDAFNAALAAFLPCRDPEDLTDAPARPRRRDDDRTPSAASRRTPRPASAGRVPAPLRAWLPFARDGRPGPAPRRVPALRHLARALPRPSSPSWSRRGSGPRITSGTPTRSSASRPASRPRSWTPSRPGACRICRTHKARLVYDYATPLHRDRTVVTGPARARGRAARRGGYRRAGRASSATTRSSR